MSATTGVAVAEEMMAEPISLSVGGRSMWGVAVVDSDAEDNKNDIAISNDVLLVFKGSTVLDGGLEVGVRIDIEGEESDDQGDGKYAYVSGSFGDIRVGNDDTASHKMSTAAPYATYFYGINTPFWAGSLSGEWHSTFAGAGAGGASVLYFSPVINGFQFGASYTPEAGTEARSDTVYSDEGQDAYSVGLRYDGAVGDAGVTVAAGYTSKEVAAVEAKAATGLFAGDSTGDNGVGEAAVAAAPGRTETDWNAGLVVSMAGVSVGGSYRSNDQDMDGIDDEVQYDIGAMYGEGPWAISVNFGNKSQDSENVDTDFSRLMATYNLGPGVNLAGVVGRDSPSSNDDTSFGAVALLVSF